MLRRLLLLGLLGPRQAGSRHDPAALGLADPLGVRLAEWDRLSVELGLGRLDLALVLQLRGLPLGPLLGSAVPALGSRSGLEAIELLFESPLALLGLEPAPELPQLAHALPGGLEEALPFRLAEQVQPLQELRALLRAEQVGGLSLEPVAVLGQAQLGEKPKRISRMVGEVPAGDLLHPPFTLLGDLVDDVDVRHGFTPHGPSSSFFILSG